MNTLPTKPAVDPKSNNPANTSTPVTNPAAQQVKQASSVPDPGLAGNATSKPSGNAGGGENATSTSGAAPVVSTDGAKQAVAHAPNERDVSQGSAAKGGAGGPAPHPVTGGQTNEYRIRGNELLQFAAQRFGINIASGVTEFVWDAASNDLVVKHSPPFSGVQGGTGPGQTAPEVK